MESKPYERRQPKRSNWLFNNVTSGLRTLLGYNAEEDTITEAAAHEDNGKPVETNPSSPASAFQSPASKIATPLRMSSRSRADNTRNGNLLTSSLRARHLESSAPSETVPSAIATTAMQTGMQASNRPLSTIDKGGDNAQPSERRLKRSNPDHDVVSRAAFTVRPHVPVVKISKLVPPPKRMIAPAKQGTSASMSRTAQRFLANFSSMSSPLTDAARMAHITSAVTPRQQLQQRRKMRASRLSRPGKLKEAVFKPATQPIPTDLVTEEEGVPRKRSKPAEGVAKPSGQPKTSFSMTTTPGSMQATATSAPNTAVLKDLYKGVKPQEDKQAAPTFTKAPKLKGFAKTTSSADPDDKDVAKLSKPTTVTFKKQPSFGSFAPSTKADDKNDKDDKPSTTGFGTSKSSFAFGSKGQSTTSDKSSSIKSNPFGAKPDGKPSPFGRGSSSKLEIKSSPLDAGTTTSSKSSLLPSKTADSTKEATSSVQPTTTTTTTTMALKARPAAKFSFGKAATVAKTSFTTSPTKKAQGFTFGSAQPVAKAPVTEIEDKPKAAGSTTAWPSKALPAYKDAGLANSTSIGNTSLSREAFGSVAAKSGSGGFTFAKGKSTGVKTTTTLIRRHKSFTFAPGAKVTSTNAASSTSSSKLAASSSTTAPSTPSPSKTITTTVKKVVKTSPLPMVDKSNTPPSMPATSPLTLEPASPLMSGQASPNTMADKDATGDKAKIKGFAFGASKPSQEEAKPKTGFNFGQSSAGKVAGGSAFDTSKTKEENNNIQESDEKDDNGDNDGKPVTTANAGFVFGNKQSTTTTTTSSPFNKPSTGLSTASSKTEKANDTPSTTSTSTSATTTSSLPSKPTAAFNFGAGKASTTDATSTSQNTTPATAASTMATKPTGFGTPSSLAGFKFSAANKKVVPAPADQSATTTAPAQASESKSTPFTFGAAPSNTPPATSSAAPAAPAANKPFTFGAAPSSNSDIAGSVGSTAQPFAFGAAPTTTSASATNTNATTNSTAKPFVFGAKPATSTPAAAPAPGNFQFGAAPGPSSQPVSSTTTGMGGTSSGGNAPFKFGAAPTPQPTGGMPFGGTPATGGNSSGLASTAQNQGGIQFGASSGNTGGPTPFAFGASNPNVNSSGGSQSQSNDDNSMSTGPSPSATPTPDQQPAIAPFGQQQQSSAPFAFGAKPATSTPTFGAAPTTGSAFGSGTSGFGSSPAQGGFGSTPATGGFGGASKTASPFGANNNNNTGFGAMGNSNSNTGFGAAATAAKNPGFSFAKKALGANTSSPSTNPGFSFAGKNQSGTTPASGGFQFGGNAPAGNTSFGNNTGSGAPAAGTFNFSSGKASQPSGQSGQRRRASARRRKR
eukprot:TRINITY_DN10924_c0_g1_i1.p1 TRINITY_DN10924_c0_g1~~TRINITY_DN10924_c0_g1_i1.p1  ORF type:complete len:1353 (+),score=394.50 TRINITY_DN10924_c0_g1_i1:47-4105(+)